jgi:hypothetical protein
MGSLIEELKRQEEAARAEADRLRAYRGACGGPGQGGGTGVAAGDRPGGSHAGTGRACRPCGRARRGPRPASPIGAVTVPP